MNTYRWFWVLIFTLILSCKSNPEEKNTEEKNLNEQNASFRIALGSCNRQDKPQEYWATIQKDSADIFIWGGDNIYADTPDMELMQSMYDSLKSNHYYSSFASSLPHSPIGVWDDHDYGKNDAGKAWEYKDKAKQHYMDFFDIDSTHAMRERGGIYHSEVVRVGERSVKFYLLDTRYFRDGLVEADNKDKRYKAHTTTDSTLLGNEQWKWLEREFQSSESDFNIIVSSIQFLSDQHGFETWGLFPHEIEKMQNLLLEYDVKNILFLSGDRHISEISEKEVKGMKYPLTDFTSSGLTHSYTSYEGEPNPYRVSKVIAETSYGIVDLNFETDQTELKIKSTDDGRILETHELNFED